MTWEIPCAIYTAENTHDVMQIGSVVEELRAFDIAKVVASPFIRCVQTAAAVLDGLHLPQNALEYDWQICEVLPPLSLLVDWTSPVLDCRIPAGAGPHKERSSWKPVGSACCPH